VWVTFVLLLGLPGFLAYLIEHRRAKLETCSECGKVVPRDREACAACDAEFAAPARVGTEIFA
jgi:predicted amidophosphoribosyltransferase